MYVRYQFSRLCLGLCLLALASVQVVHAQTTVDRAAFDRFMGVVSGNNTTVGYGAGGVPLATSAGALGSGYQPLGNMQTGINAGALEAKGVATLNLPNGRSAALNVASAVNKPSIGGALLNFAKKTAYPLQVGLAVVALAQELNMALSKDSSGALVVQKQDPDVCTTAPCYSFTTRSPTATTPTAPYLASRRLACLRAAEMYTTWAGRPYTVANDNYNPSFGMGSCYLTWVYLGVTYYAEHQYFYQSASPSAPVFVPATEQEFIDAIANKSGWPSTSALAPAVKQAVESGESVKLETSTVTGPGSVVGPSSTTTTGGTTTTKNENYNITYNTNNVSYTTTVTTTVNDGTTTTTTTETKDKDKALDQCEKYPNSAGCSDLGNPTSDTLNKKTQAVAVVAATFASASGCPSPLSFSVRSLSYSFSYQPLCDRLVLLKVLFLAIAGVLAAYILADSFRVQ